MVDTESFGSDPFDEIERMVGLMSEQFGTQRSGVATDVIDAGEEFVVRANLPGFDVEDIDVAISDERTLEITAERTESSDEEGRFVKRERRQQTARRTVALPDAVDSEAASASYDAGVLTVRLRKQTTDDETTIPVN